MPHYGTATGCKSLPKKWYLRPVGIRGIWSFRKFHPFLSGDVLELKLIIESDGHDSKDYEYSWVLLQRLSDLSEKAIDQDTKTFTTNRGVTKIPLKTHLLQYEGEYRLFLTLTPNAPAEPHKQTLMNFKVLAQDVYYVNWQIGLTSGLMGALIGLIIGHIIK